MTDDALLEMIKLNLDIAGSARDGQLKFLLESAKEELRGKGIRLNLTQTRDLNLIVMYTSWLYRDRAQGGGVSQPRMLQYAIHNRQIKEATNDQI